MGVCNSCFYIANSNTIKVIDINYALAETQDTHIYPKSEDILTHHLGTHCKLHGFFEDSFAHHQLYLYCLIETEDNQIDFTRLYFYSRNLVKGDLVFKQSQEVVHRTTKLDPIAKFKQIIHESNF